MKINKNLKFIGWDGTEFESPTEMLEYNEEKYKENFNTIQFFCYQDYDSFDLIPNNLYKEMQTNMQIYHSSDLILLYYYLRKAPIVYCHDEAAAEAMNGLCCTKKLPIGEFGVGYSFFSDEKGKFISLDKLPRTTLEAPAFNKLLETMNHFIKENVA